MKRGVDYIGVGVGALIFNKKGEIFLTLRGSQANKLPLSVITKYDLKQLKLKYPN